MSDAAPASPKLYDVIYADPPWRYSFSKTTSRQIENQYETMTHEDICGLQVPAAKDAVLYLWAVAPKLPEALEVMASWGFTYKTSAVWDKELIGMGYWFRGQHEHLLVGVRGKFSPPAQPDRISSVIREKRGRHSAKPTKVRDFIRDAFPDARRLEMFCRDAAEGWDVWGNEVESTAAIEPTAPAAAESTSESAA